VHLLAVILSIVLIVVLAASSVADFTHQPQIVATMERLGMPKNFEVIAGVVKTAAALGLLVGLVHGPHRAQGGLTVLTAWCLAAYFVIAVVAHLRAKDPAKETGPAVVLLVASAVLALAA
jgi:hypothetical protein